MHKFSRELLRRIPLARQDVARDNYSMYVRWGRARLGMDRAALAEHTGLGWHFITFLENGLLLPGELSERRREAIERALSVSYDEFQRHVGEMPASGSYT